jgi:hypothetical protein
MLRKRLLANELRDLEIAEVSLVRRGANRKKFLILKALGGDPMNDDVLSRVLDADLDPEDEERINGVLKAQGLSDKAANAVKAALRILNAFKDELPHDVLNILAGLASYGYQPAPLPASEEAKASRSQPKDHGDYGEYGEYGEYGKQRGKGKPKLSAKAEERARRDELVRKAALGIVADRDQAWQAIQRASQAMFGRDDALGVDMLMQTGLGLELYRAYLTAPAPPPPAPVSKAAADDEDVPAWTEVRALAQQLVQKSGECMTEAQAVAHVLNSARGRQLYKRYLSEKQLLIASRGR